MADVNEDWRTSVKCGFFLGKRDDQYASLSYIGFDIIESESLTLTSKVTRNPVEGGAPIADHVIDMPDEMEITIMVSDVSMQPDGRFPPSDPFTSMASRSAAALELLDGLRRSHEPLDYQGGFKLHRNMVIERITVHRDRTTAAALVATVVLSEVQIRSTQSVTYPPRKAGKPHRKASKTVAQGEKKTEPVTNAQKGESIALSLLPESAKEQFKQGNFMGALGALTGGP